jgi:hypothetical protein
VRPNDHFARRERLTDVANALRITWNAELVDIGALAVLERVGGRIAIENNPKLESLDGLQGLTMANELVELRDNAALADLHGLDGLVYARSLARGDPGRLGRRESRNRRMDSHPREPLAAAV